jgi:GT2 family glycosyltransferase
MTADWVVVLRNGDELAHGALARLADRAISHPQADVIYGDHDVVDERRRRHSPQFKPDWNPPLFHAYDYIAGVAAFRRAKALAVGGLKSAFTRLEVDDLLLRVAAASPEVVHIPRILCHRGSRFVGEDFHQAAQRRCQMLRDQFAGKGDNPTIELDRFAQVRVMWNLPEPEPVVSLIIPTRDRIDLLRPCIESLRRTAYSNFEILIVDNGSRQKRTLSYFSELSKDARVRVCTQPGPFNFAALNNATVRLAQGSVIGFINNDVEAIEPEWLSEMVRHAVRPEIGAVGALLLYPGGNVQHAGVIVGLQGLAGHGHRFFPAEHLGYMRRLQTAQYVTAVTAACLLIEKRKFDEVGGFDEVSLPVALNDVDLCLKLHVAGYRNFYTPYAKLLHKESASRDWDLSRVRREAYERECANFKAKWSHMMNDPYYNPNLTQATEDFALL